MIGELRWKTPQYGGRRQFTNSLIHQFTIHQFTNSQASRMSTQWEFLVTLNERLRPLKDPVAIQEAAVGLLGAHLHASRVHYAQIDGDDFVISKAWVADGVSHLPSRGRVNRYGEAIVLSCRRGETIVAMTYARTHDSGTRNASNFSLARQPRSLARH